LVVFPHPWDSQRRCSAQRSYSSRKQSFIASGHDCPRSASGAVCVYAKQIPKSWQSRQRKFLAWAC
jgi:hypothetical protein